MKEYMKNLSINILVLTILLTGCATTNTSNEKISKIKPDLLPSQEQKWAFMTGKWFGSQPTKDGGVKQEIMVRAPQGTYQITFRIYDKEGKYKEQTEAGHWGVSGPIYFTSFRGWVKGKEFSPANPSDPYNYDAYKIIKLNNEIFEYKALSSENTFLLKKVPNDYVFPEQ